MINSLVRLLLLSSLRRHILAAVREISCPSGMCVFTPFCPSPDTLVMLFFKHVCPETVPTAACRGPEATPS